MNTLQQLQQFGQSIWYDNIQRNMLGENGELTRMIREDHLAGVTSNPTIFEKAISASHDYDEQITQLLAEQTQMDSRAIFFSLAIQDIQQAADLLQPVYERSQGRDGYVSLEVSPDLAYDIDTTIAEAKHLVERVDRPNLMIKIPSTREGLTVIERLTAAGINVNATLLFSVHRYEEVAQAYIRGLEQRLVQGLWIGKIASVASFFVSRVDTLADTLLAEKRPHADAEDRGLIDELTGQVAILNAKEAYAIYHHLYGDSFQALREAGAQPQRLLWASSGTKNPAYSDVRYLDQLIGPDTVNTVPPATYQAYLDHGQPARRLENGILEAREQLLNLTELGIDLAAATQQLEADGVKSFQQAFHNLLASIEAKTHSLAA